MVFGSLGNRQWPVTLNGLLGLGIGWGISSKQGGIVPVLTEVQRKRIFEEEKVRASARLKFSLTLKNIVIYFLFLGLLVSALFYLGNRPSARNMEPLISLDNEIFINLSTLKDVEDSDKSFIAGKTGDIGIYDRAIYQDTLVASMKWNPERFKEADLETRFGLLQAGVKVLKMNRKMQELTDPTSKTSHSKLLEAAKQELQAIDAYYVAAQQMESVLDEALRGLPNGKQLRLRTALNR
jgi:hypothetical protein